MGVDSLEVKLFYRTQRDLAIAINELIDRYWENQIEENELIEGINTIYENNKDKLLKDEEFTKVVQQQCGKRRLNIVRKIIGNLLSL